MEQSPSWDTNRFLSYSRIFPHFLDPEGSLPHSQKPSILPYSKPDQSSPCPPSPISWRSILLLSSTLLLSLPCSFFHSRFLTITLYTALLSPLRATWPAQLILLDLISLIIFGKDYRSLNSSLYRLLHSLITSLHACYRTS